MGVILILILASLAIAAGFLVAFIWSVRTGQFDDTETPSLRMLPDDAPASSPPPRSAAKPHARSS